MITAYSTELSEHKVEIQSELEQANVQVLPVPTPLRTQILNRVAPDVYQTIKETYGEDILNQVIQSIFE